MTTKVCSVLVYFINKEEKKEERLIQSSQEEVYKLMTDLMTRGLQLKTGSVLEVYPPQRICYFRVLGFNFNEELSPVPKIGF